MKHLPQILPAAALVFACIFPDTFAASTIFACSCAVFAFARFLESKKPAETEISAQELADLKSKVSALTMATSMRPIHKTIR